MSSLDSMAKDMSELLLDNIDKKKMYLASVARKMRYLLVKRKDHYDSYERLFNELLCRRQTHGRGGEKTWDIS